MSQNQPIVLDPTHASFDAAARPADLGPTHFIGIGGAGMSVLAEMLNAEGVPVDGSDRERSAKTDRLESLGITVEFGQRAENVASASTVVYSSAIKPSNPEIVAANEAGLHVVHRSDILALLMNGKRAVTVAGAHGKTTTSSMLAHILVHTGADPSYAIGGSIQGPDGTTLDGGHAGQGDVLVAEADESDGSFAKYHPTIAIITNAEADHLDHYGDEAHYRAAFVNHAGHATGHVVICADDPDALAVFQALPADIKAHTVVYGTTPIEQLPDLGGAAHVWISSEQETAGTGVERLTLHLPAAVTSADAVASVWNSRFPASIMRVMPPRQSPPLCCWESLPPTPHRLSVRSWELHAVFRCTEPLSRSRWWTITRTTLRRSRLCWMQHGAVIRSRPFA